MYCPTFLYFMCVEGGGGCNSTTFSFYNCLTRRRLFVLKVFFYQCQTFGDECFKRAATGEWAEGAPPPQFLPCLFYLYSWVSNSLLKWQSHENVDLHFIIQTCTFFLYESGITMLLYSVLYHCVQIILDFRLLDISQHPCCELQGLITCCF